MKPNTDKPCFQPKNITALSLCDIFQCGRLANDERRSLDEIFAAPQLLKANSELIADGARVSRVFILIDGWAYQHKTTADGAQSITGLIMPGSLCNMDSLLFANATYGVRLLTDATAVGLPVDRLRTVAAAMPGIARLFSTLAIQEGAILREWAVSLGRRSAREALAHFLCEMAIRLGGFGRDVVEFDLPLTQVQIADVLGLTTVHVNRTMQRLRAEGVICGKRPHVIVPNWSALSEISGFDPSYLQAI